MRWDYAGIGEFEEALTKARDEGKLVMVGLSGSETCCSFSRFEADGIATTLTDPAIAKLSGEFVRLIIRRPNAYWFLEELTGTSNEQSVLALPEGLKIGDREILPIPGVYFLDPNREVRGTIALLESGAQRALEETMRRLSAD